MRIWGKEAGLVWPSKKLLKAYFGIGTLLYLQCFLVYGLTNWLATFRDEYYHLYFSWERFTPFVPQFVYVYMSMALFLLLPLFYVKELHLKPWAVSYVVMTLVAGLIFLLFPATLAVGRSVETANSNTLFSLIYMLDHPHNLFPSLHVAYTTLAMQLAYFYSVTRKVFWIIFLWWFALTLSVLLVHQHQLLDIVGGILLSHLCYRYIFLRLVRIQSA